MMQMQKSQEEKLKQKTPKREKSQIDAENAREES